MFGLGLSEILLILGLALIFIGPERLPDLARSLARGYAEFRRSFDDVKSTIEKDIRAVDTENLLRQGKAFPLDEVKKSLLGQGDKLIPPNATADPYPVESAADSPPAVVVQPVDDFRSDFRTRLKDELRAEILAELRAELKLKEAKVDGDEC